MPIADAMIAELAHEAATTRKVLERIPEDRFGWKPHDRSMTMGQLASHVVDSLGWGQVTLKQDEFDIPADYTPWQASSSRELVERFDTCVAELTKAMTSYPDQNMMKPWTLKSGGQDFFTLPRVAVLRSMIFNHLIHHRGQLSVYLRLNDIPVPSIYGPSADEQS